MQLNSLEASVAGDVRFPNTHRMPAVGCYVAVRLFCAPFNRDLVSRSSIDVAQVKQ